MRIQHKLRRSTLQKTEQKHLSIRLTELTDSNLPLALVKVGIEMTIQPLETKTKLFNIQLTRDKDRAIDLHGGS